jgi:tetratricopeptide (TPR) repeat protein
MADMNKRNVLQKTLCSLLIVIVLCISSAFAKHEKELKEINALLENNKYESAATYIEASPDLMNDSRFIRLYSHILTNYYMHTINFHLFALRDLEIGEKIEDYRGGEGKYTLVGADLEELLYEKYNESPESPDLNFAVGEYIAIGETCGCGQPQLFVGDKGSDYPYFLKAYQAGIYDYFSLFRLGYHEHRNPNSDLKDVASYYEKSLELKPDHTPAAYNLATIYYGENNLEHARKYAKQALGKYGDNDLNADTYNVYGHIEYAAGNITSAEESLLKALELKNWHESAFIALIRLYRTDGQEDKYVERVMNYIAADYSNTFLFNIYIDYLMSAGLSEWDKKVSTLLAKKEFNEPIQAGAVFFNLGRMAEFMDDKELALSRYRKSLEEMQSLEAPPEGSIEALKQAISRLTEE